MKPGIEPDCTTTFTERAILMCRSCCPIEVEPDDHPKGYDYGKGYTFTWPPQPLLGFAVPEDAEHCTYTTTFDLDDPTVTYFVPKDRDFIEVFGTYTIVNDQGTPCPETVTDSLIIEKVEDSPPINCCPIECEPGGLTMTDYGDGVVYAFPADPGPMGPQRVTKLMKDVHIM